MGVVTGAIISAVIGAGASAYAADKQEDIANKERKRLEEEEKRRIDEANRIAADTRPVGETLDAITFGSGFEDLGSTSDFLIPKPTTGTSGLGTSKAGGNGQSSGLGFSV